MTMKHLFCAAISLVSVAGLTSLAQAEMVLSQVIVDLLPGEAPREDVEVWNDGTERLYVLAEPFEIRGAGTTSEERVRAVLPDEAGILVSPQRLVLEPGERRIIRISAIGERPRTDRVYRVAIRPVAGAVSADVSALKVFVGYDALVIVRPDQITNDIEVERSGRTLVLHNVGNTAQEFFDGQQCDAEGRRCQSLPAKRLYAGATWEQALPFETVVSYKSAIGPDIRERQFQ